MAEVLSLRDAYYVAAPVRETDDVIAHLQEPDFFFGSRVTRFSRDPSCYNIGSYVSFPRGSHMQKQYLQRTTLPGGTVGYPAQPG